MFLFIIESSQSEIPQFDFELLIQEIISQLHAKLISSLLSMYYLFAFDVYENLYHLS